MGVKQTNPGTLRHRMGQARKLRGRRRERELAALEQEKQELVLSVHDWVWQRVNAFYKRYHLQRQDRDDLAQAAFERVVIGAETYDPSKGAPTTYFGWVAWDGMRKWFDARSMIHVPRSAARADGSEYREQAERVGGASVLSLSWDYADDGRPDAWEVDEPEERPYGFDELERLRAALRFLAPRERQVLLGRMAGRPQRDLAAEHGVSVARVQQIEQKALEKLRRRLLPSARQNGVKALRASGKAHRLTDEDRRKGANTLHATGRAHELTTEDRRKGARAMHARLAEEGRETPSLFTSETARKAARARWAKRAAS